MASSLPPLSGASQERVQPLSAMLRETEEVLRNLAEQSLVGIQILQGGRYAYANTKLAEIFGYTHEEVMALESWTTVVAEEDREMVVEQVRQRLAGAIPRAHYVFRGLRKDRRIIDVEVRSDRIELRGEPAVLGMLVDVTDRRQAQEALRLRDRAIQAVTQGIVITDPKLPDNPIIFANRGFEQITGYSASEAVGRNCLFLQGPETDPAALAQIRESLRSQQPCTAELLNLRKDGSKFWNALSLSPVVNEAGRLTHFVGVLADVTERRQLEERFRQAQKMDAFGKLAGGVAHDFNNLLTVILGCCEILADDAALSGDSRQLVNEIQKAGQRGSSLTRQLLAFSRQQILQPRVLNLSGVVDRTASMLERLIGEDVSLTTRLHAQLWSVKVDEGQIEQVLMNLAVNARDAMPQGGQLTIETRNIEVDEGYVQIRPDLKPGSYVVLSVSDTGCGMDEATRARIFEPFFTTKGPGKGTGLGLATVFGIVKQSEGHVAVYSEPGRGTTFTIYLPKADGSASSEPKDEGLVSLPRGTETVLLAEDAETVRGIVSHRLQTLGYTVFEAQNGSEAVRHSQDHPGPIHLLLTDVVMPEMSGRELSERLRAARPNLKVLFMSGFTDDSMLRHGVLAEEANFIQKPFSLVTLSQKIRAALDG